MKRIIAAALLAALLLSGCAAAQDDLEGAATKAQAIEIRDAEGEEILSITDSEGIEGFVSALETESWLPAGLPEDAKLLCTAEFYQEKTVKLGQTQPEGWDLVLRMELYEGGVIAVELLSTTMALELTPSAAEYLEGLLP
mgnify:FL=1